MDNELEFTFSWKALDMLGKSLYSNPWSAISELVANGFDGGATTVYVHIDASNKSESVVEILDDGSGLDNETLENYVNVGFDRRAHARRSGATPSEDIMGRKGIGKLAALYLSDEYSIITKTDERISSWQTGRSQANNNLDSKPKLLRQETIQDCALLETLSNNDSGTIIYIDKVNLARYGEASFNALSQRLANQFLIEGLGKEILLSVITSPGSPEFSPVAKQVAFKNLMFVYRNYPNECEQPQEIQNLVGKNVTIPIRNKRDDLTRGIEVLSFSEKQEQFGYKGTQLFITESGETVLKAYELTGWLGLHSTIDTEKAKDNDVRFVKNQFYNPSQIRLYVRNKLAMENILPLVGNTQAFSNYIEGEVSFNILDDDDLPDIATSSRQSFDETDQRVELLKDILKKMVGDLVRKREAIQDEIRTTEKTLDDEDDTRAKAEVVTQMADALSSSNLPEEEASSISLEFANMLKGGLSDIGAKAKSQYLLFLSHKRSDRIITEFFYRILRNRGATPEEFFYTSNDDTPALSKDLVALSDKIKEAVTSTNNMVVYFPTMNFKKSEFCLFEGGAGWAVRSGDYHVFSDCHQHAPEFLVKDRGNCPVLRDRPAETIMLNEKNYRSIVELLNNMIVHLNAGRRANNTDELTRFQEPNIPDAVKIKKLGKVTEDFFDPEIVQYWDEYVTQHLETYAPQLEADSEKSAKK